MGENGHPASVRAKLKNKAQPQGKEFNLVLTRPILESIGQSFGRISAVLFGEIGRL